MLAAAAIGLHPDIESAATAMSGIARRHEPQPAAAAQYDRLYHVYREIYPALSPVFRGLARASAPERGGS
jgi:xylulokinase